MRFTIELTTPACPVKDQMREQARAAVAAGARRDRGRDRDDGRRPDRGNPRRHTRRRTGREERDRRRRGQGRRREDHRRRQSRRGAGARAAAASDCSTATSTGRTCPIMLGLQTQLTTDGKKILPAEKYGIQVVSMGFLTNDDSPVIWRGPMLHGAIQQFFREVAWDNLDYLVVDMPPGTGDVALEPESDGARLRRHRRHDAAAGVAGRHAACGADVPEAEHPDDRPDREHEPLRVSRVRPRERHLRARRRRGAGADMASRSSAASRSTSRSAKAATPDDRSSSTEPDSPAGRAFVAVAEQAAAQVSIASYARADPGDAGQVASSPNTACVRRAGGPGVPHDDVPRVVSDRGRAGVGRRSGPCRRLDDAC